MQKHNRRVLSPSREEFAELAVVIDPNPPELPKEVVVLLRQARRYCGQIIKTLRHDEYECVAMQCDYFADSIDELLQKYCYSISARGYDCWEWEQQTRD